MNNNAESKVTYSVGIPGVVVGVLLALKFAGLTMMSYSDIIWYGVKVWLVCAAIVLAIWVVAVIVTAMFDN